ncbi:LysR family transcriptional regulator [Saccharopolyspora spinosa]|uniref:DNA-binding transcriptional LysR family regulator n=1 Tax=Saccharopolyspora spinosa TaxID=60894 RepID=A0A2N3Y6X4_SACSN|nr:LysR substrate-binding domain-containing protein [Saccharopolyspora spinosa]PKW18625.1 DNA-binding transcriptional LysR family regulator [Saccharopolyspora spinosa]
MQLHQLQYFVAVVDARHFTRAAAQVGVAQPSLSQQIRALEQSLGARLFHRTRGNIALTDAGETLLPIARRILADADTARREIRALDELRAGRVRLGATPSLCTGLLPPMVAAFRREHPGIELIIHEGGSRDLQTELSEGALDLALVIDSRLANDPVLETMPLFIEELVVVSPLGAPRPVRRSHINIQELQGRPLVMFRRGYDLRESTIAACRTAGFEPTLAIEGGEMDAVLEFVNAGMGLAVVPATVVRDRFRGTPIADPGLTRTVYLAQRRGMAQPRAAQALQDEIIRFLYETSATGQLPPGVHTA